MQQQINLEYCRQATENFRPEKYDYLAVLQYLIMEDDA